MFKILSVPQNSLWKLEISNKQDFYKKSFAWRGTFGKLYIVFFVKSIKMRRVPKFNDQAVELNMTHYVFRTESLKIRTKTLLFRDKFISNMPSNLSQTNLKITFCVKPVNFLIIWLKSLYSSIHESANMNSLFLNIHVSKTFEYFFRSKINSGAGGFLVGFRFYFQPFSIVWYLCPLASINVFIEWALKVKV